MKTFLCNLAVALSVILLCVCNTSAQELRGPVGKSSQWGSGWIDLRTITDFKKGDTLQIKVGGIAKRVLIRLLSKEYYPDSPSGIEGDAREVPANRVITVVLESDHTQVKQISVHGGPNPWGLSSLGEDNGPASLISVLRKSYQPPKPKK